MTAERAITDGAQRAGQPARSPAVARTGASALLFVMAVAGLGACASDHSGSDAKKDGGHPIRIQYIQFTTGQKFELIDKSLSSSSDVYSKTRRLEDASTKVTTDEILQETLDFFESKGFFEKAERGGSPGGGQGVFSQSIEIETPERFVHMSVQRGTPPADLKVFSECCQAFITIYNETYQLQSVDHPPDWNSQTSSGKPPPKKKLN